MNEIHTATEQGDLERVKEILHHDPAQVHARTTEEGSGDQPLHLAAWQGKKKIAEALLDAGADINATGDGGRTPLFYAVEKNHPTLIKMLIDRGANVNVNNEARCSPLYIAAAVGDQKAV